MNMKQIVMASASVVLSKEELTDLADYYNYIGDLSKEHFSDILLKSEVTENQGILIYAYCYLYLKLTMQDTTVLNTIKNAFGLPKYTFISCGNIITRKRIDYILEDFSKNGKSAHDIFKDNDSYITKMLEKVVFQPRYSDKKKLSNLLSSEYEHPTDRKYLDNLNTNKAFEKIVKLFFEYGLERILTVQYTGSNIKVTEKNIPYLYNAVKTVCETLDVDIPPVYVSSGPLNACTIGANEPIVVISNACLSLLSYDELLFIIGHEIGHIKSQHVMYHTIGNILPYIAQMIGNVTLGIGEIALKGVVLLLYNWYRMSEYTADRAGLLACQNIDAAVSVMAKLSGFPPSCYDDLDNSDFLDQAVDFENIVDNGIYEKLVKLLSELKKSHPWTVLRAKELRSWYDVGEYDKIMNVKERKKQDGRNPKKIINDLFDKKIFCSHCGKQISQSDYFCEYCGKENIYRKGL